MRKLTTTVEHWPLASAFVISRGAKTEAEVIVTTITDGPYVGRSECVPYARYGETVLGVMNAINEAEEAIADAMVHRTVVTSGLRGASANAVDCALWDLEAKQSGRGLIAKLGSASEPLTTAYTLSLDTSDAMAKAARIAANYPLLKLKLGGDGDEDRLRAVRKARPDARLVVDANEAWTPNTLASRLAVAAEVCIEVVEQPLPADNDAMLAEIPHPVPVCADESAHTAAELPKLVSRYDAVNIKLDKAGGLSGALDMATAARAAQMKIMVGCMVGTSLAMAPAYFVAQLADWVDLDGPLLLASDRDPGLVYDGALLSPPSPALWG